MRHWNTLTSTPERENGPLNGSLAVCNSVAKYLEFSQSSLRWILKLEAPGTMYSGVVSPVNCL